MNSQRGVSLLGLIVVGFLLVMVAIPTIRVVPEYLEYYKILKNVKAVAQDPGSRGASVADVRGSLRKRFDVDQVTVIRPEDMEISRQGDGVDISFAYSRKVALVGNVSLLIEFEGSSSGT